MIVKAPHPKLDRLLFLFSQIVRPITTSTRPYNVLKTGRFYKAEGSEKVYVFS